MAETTDIPVKNLDSNRIPSEVLKYVPQDAAVHYEFIPLGLVDGVLEVGMVDPDDIEARDALQFIATKTKLPFKIYLISKVDFTTALGSYEGLSGQVDKALGQLKEDIESDKSTVASVTEKTAKDTKPTIVEDAPVTKIVSVILQHAIGGNASDIHIEPVADQLKVRF